MKLPQCLSPREISRGKARKADSPDVRLRLHPRSEYQQGDWTGRALVRDWHGEAPLCPGALRTTITAADTSAHGPSVDLPSRGHRCSGLTMARIRAGDSLSSRKLGADKSTERRAGTSRPRRTYRS